MMEELKSAPASADRIGATLPPPAISGRVVDPATRRRVKGFVVLTVVLAAAFARPLYDLVRFALHNDLYSHVLLIPFISAYLIRTSRRDLALNSAPARWSAVLPLVAGLGVLAGYWSAVHSGWRPTREDYLALMVLSFLCLLAAVGFAFLGTRTLRQLAFPAAFLVFTIPFPTALRQGIETFFQHGSADAADLLFRLSGMPMLRDGMEFHLPGFSLEVAPQCSGIHSSLVLFITSLLAGHLFLKSVWRRGALTLAVIPLALLRNGVRIVTLGQLCVHVSPDMINSPIHHHGGPLFFALSLIPFFLLLWMLRRSERPPRARQHSATE